MADLTVLGDASAHEPERGAVCTNCGAELQGQWCSRCGQKWAPLDPTWHDVLHEAVHELIHLDGKVFRTVRLLFAQPGELTAEFLRGRRASYIGPLRLYLTFSLIYFLLAAIVPNPNPGQTAASAREGEAILEQTLTKALPKVVFAMVPVFAWLLMLSYRNRRRHYPQYLYFSLHLHAALFGFLTLTVPLQALDSELWLQIATLVAIGATFVFLVLALKRVFGGRTRAAVLRACALTLAHTVVFLATVGAIVQLVLSGVLGRH